MVNNQLFKKLSDESQLGEIIGVPVSISGGLLHKTYAIETDKGKYAVKILNPQIMLRPDAMMNYINSERVANLVSKKVPAVPAKIIYGNFIQTIDSQFYIVFDWIESITLESSVINSSHSEKIGSILADIHGTDFSELQLKKDLGNNEQSVNWEYYIQQGQKSNAEWVESLLEIVDKLYEWSTLAYKANRVLSTNLVISHRDLDPKNVLWNKDNPVIIDRESAGYVNPMHDLIETALYWSKDKTENIVKERFFAFINGYKKRNGETQANWSTVLENGYLGKLGWLEYNLKRSLWIECTDGEEQKMGTTQVVGTIKEIKYYAEIISKLVDWLNNVE
ncbi:aminoglycoside phosphotransferase family protein [Psychrobacillus sp. Sa2BUA9]|uniref:Aminoglycoside phosphotransferase family protein n=1 Tax=Psychrobacillus faecigallinarum TaxID=2762235 RepID=A0ABR8RAP5_9BACI|nr:aminoglycoside phosphotransferase family protein [Psychrobacillus faecigallinarum]MBD7944815.1 aminoglycoside phosphotransferase family protein [Psychrobacillus faecigallinarum]